jgi:uncharacterized protein (TIGR02145 family)
MDMADQFNKLIENALKKKIALLMMISLACLVTRGQMIKDRDGNEYHTVTIGSQQWMVENLKVNHYKNGDTIPELTEQKEWSDSKTGARCDYKGNSINALFFGHLYNGFAALDKRSICPEGWHVPTDSEWTVLIEFLGEGKAGGRMQATKIGIYPNTDSSNSSGFTSLAAGFRLGGPNIRTDRSYGHIADAAMYWTSTKSSETNVWVRRIIYDHQAVQRLHSPLKSGLSVRCIRN